MNKDITNSDSRASTDCYRGAYNSRVTWFPVLVGVLGGLIAFTALAMLETPAFYRLSALVFSEDSPKALFAKPGYYCIHRTILLVLAALGGVVGIRFSRWPRTHSSLFLLATLALLAVFAAIGFH
jgi:hypothetical protein